MKDGVTLIAEAIRKEREAEAKKQTPTQPVTVSDVTAQFSSGGTPADNKEKDAKDKEENKDEKEKKEEGKDNE